MRLTKLLGICGSILLSIVLAVPVLADGPIDASVTRTQRFNAPSDIVPAATRLSGQLTWDISMYNHAGENSSPPTDFNYPSITLNSLLTSIKGDLFYFQPGNVIDNTAYFPLTFQEDVLLHGSGIRVGWNYTDQYTMNTPGYDSLRSVSPRIIPANTTNINQTVIVKMALKDSRYALTSDISSVSMGGSISGTCMNIDVGSQTNIQTTCNGNGASWTVSNPTVGTDYTLTIVLKVSNPTSAPVISEPWMSTQAGINHRPRQTFGYSVTITDPSDPSLDSVVFAVDENTAEWHPRTPDLTFIVDYPAIWETVSATDITPPADTTPPTITSLTVDHAVLWPPNHKMIPIGVTANASDDNGSATCKISSVTSNEPENGLGDGDTAPDYEITGDLTVNLRAERSGNGIGRVYTATVSCSDAAGNTATKNVTVTVPKDQGKK